MLIALIAALVVLATDMVKTIVGWIFLLLGSNNAWLGQSLGFAGAITVILIFIRRFEHLLHD